MKKIVIPITVWSIVMTAIAYFALPAYAGKFLASCQFGLAWGIVTGTILYFSFKLIRAMAERGRTTGSSG